LRSLSHESFERYLAPDAEIVHSPVFESAIVKIQSGKVLLLTEEERTAVTRLQNPNPISTVDVVAADTPATKPLSVTRKALNAAIAMRKEAEDAKQEGIYGDLSWIPHSSNMCERLFSRAKLTLGYLRRSMTPLHFEQLIMLRANREHWNVVTVHTGINNAENLVISEGDEEGEDEEDDDDEVDEDA
jgi:hypothetical protein